MCLCKECLWWEPDINPPYFRSGKCTNKEVNYIFGDIKTTFDTNYCYEGLMNVSVKRHDKK